MPERWIKALSVKQPWANWIAEGRKTIETRLWPTEYRGELLIVSSRLPAIEPSGCAVGLVRVVDCRPMTKQDEEKACCALYPRAWAWVLEGARALEPWRVKGKLRVYEVRVGAMKERVASSRLW
jgi:hypothetical protein